MLPKITEKPWGCEVLLVETPYVVKRLVINRGHRISLQYHERKHETWYVLEGQGAMTVGDEMFNYVPGKLVVIPPGTVHRIFAGKGRTVVLEVSTTELDDVVRLEEDYGRS